MRYLVTGGAGFIGANSLGRQNAKWLDQVRTGEYRSWIEHNYRQR